MCIKQDSLIPQNNLVKDISRFGLQGFLKALPAFTVWLWFITFADCDDNQNFFKNIF